MSALPIEADLPAPQGVTLRALLAERRLRTLPVATMREFQAGLFAYCPNCNVDKWGGIVERTAKIVVHTCSDCGTAYITFEKELS